MSLMPAPSEWSPLEETFHTWDIVLLNPASATSAGMPETKVLSLWTAISISDTHEGIRTSVEINAEEPSIPLIRELITDFLFYRDNVLLYRVRVVDAEDILSRDAATVRYECVSYDKLLERRILHEDWVLDDGDINAAWRLIDYTQRRRTLGITRGTTAAGVRRQRGLDAGDDILTAINDFAQADGGFDWWIDANLKFWAVKPRRGTTHNVQWQLGAEVGEMTRILPIEDYSSLIMATGAQSEVRLPRADGQEDVYPPPDPQVVQLSTMPLGLWEMTTSDTDVITTKSLREKAMWHLADKGTIRPTYKLTLEPGVWHPGFGIGDVVMLRVNTVRANIRVPIRIEELQIGCTAHGQETVSMAVRAEEPETAVGSPRDGLTPIPTLLAPGGAPDPNGRTVQRHRLDTNDDLGALLRSMRKRLDRAERSPGIGGGGHKQILDGIGWPDSMIGSPGDYYVDTYGQQLFGPKSDATPWDPGETTWESTKAPDAVLAAKDVATLIIVKDPASVTGIRYGGNALASSTVTITFWDYDYNTVLYQTTGPGTGATIEFPVPLKLPEGSYVAVGLTAASVPVCTPSAPATKAPDWVFLLNAGTGCYTRNPGTESWNWTPTSSVDIQVILHRTFLDKSLGPETAISAAGMPNTSLNGELGSGVYLIRPGRLLGWRYRRIAANETPLTWTVWDVLSVGASNGPLPEAKVLARVTTTDEGDGEFEVRLPTPIVIDPTGINFPSNIMISVGGTAVPFDNGPKAKKPSAISGPEFTDDPNSFYGYWVTAPEFNETIGEVPYHGISTSEGAWGGNFWMFPIMQEIHEIWPMANVARSLNPPDERVEIMRQQYDPSQFWQSDYSGLSFYEGGPSHTENYYPPVAPHLGSNIEWFSARLRYDGYSGVELLPNDWYDNYWAGDSERPDYVANKYAYYTWYYDWTYFEQNASLDPDDPDFPGGDFLTWLETGAFEDGAYGSHNAETPTGSAGFEWESSKLWVDDSIVSLARMFAFDEGQVGDPTGAATALQCTPRVIQACFLPAVSTDAWWTGSWTSSHLTPRGCVSPLVTAASATATAADEPWQKQFFRQIGTNTVTFIAGVGIVPVPVAMANPAVVTAQVAGVAVGGRRVAQAQRTGDYVITVALDTAYDGDETIGWMVEAAVLTFGDPPPSIDYIRNPGGYYAYGPSVDYDEAGGSWPFELLSYGLTFKAGCVLKDFTGATVGGPFSDTDIEEVLATDGVTVAYQRILWSAGRNWYLPGESQEYRMTNPDGQTSGWSVITWFETLGFTAMQRRRITKMSPRSRAVTMIGQELSADDAELLLHRDPTYANDPSRRTQVNPLTSGDNPKAAGRAIRGKAAREARRARVAEERVDRPRRRQYRFSQEPGPETTPE